MIVFLIANKITSSDFRDEEDKWQLRGKRLRWMSARWREAAGISRVNARMYLFCSDMGQMGSSRLSMLSQSYFISAQQELFHSHIVPDSHVQFQVEVSPLCDVSKNIDLCLSGG